VENYIESKSVPITLADGKPRRLFIGFNALIKIVELLGIGPAEIQTAMSGPNMLQAIRGILWAGCIHEDKALTIETVGDLIDLTKITEVSEAITGAIALSFGKSGGDPKNAEPPAIPATEISPSTVPSS
jgi:hypothetical protein